MEIALDNIRQAEGILDELNELKENIENRINLSQVAGNEKRVLLTGNKIMRICLIAGLKNVPWNTSAIFSFQNPVSESHRVSSRTIICVHSTLPYSKSDTGISK